MNSFQANFQTLSNTVLGTPHNIKHQYGSDICGQSMSILCTLLLNLRNMIKVSWIQTQILRLCASVKSTGKQFAHTTIIQPREQTLHTSNVMYVCYSLNPSVALKFAVTSCPAHRVTQHTAVQLRFRHPEQVPFRDWFNVGQSRSRNRVLTVALRNTTGRFG